jgi:hypothetical protein
VSLALKQNQQFLAKSIKIVSDENHYFIDSFPAAGIQACSSCNCK